MRKSGDGSQSPPSEGTQPAPWSWDPDSGDRRIEILTAAARAFMTNGFAATSIDTVAELLGCTKGLIYYHFKNKADLFFAVHSYAMEQNLLTVRPIAEGSGTATERMRALAITHAMLVMTRLPFQRVTVLGLEMHIAGSTTPQQRQALRAIIRMYDEYESLFVTVIDEGIRQAEFRDCDPRLVAKPLLGSLNWMTMWYRPRPGEDDAMRERLAAQMADFVLHGLAARSS